MTYLSKVNRYALNAVATISIAILYAPIIMVVITSFFNVRRGSVDWSSFSFKWYSALIENETIATAVASSLKVGVIAVFSSLALGLIFSTYIARRDISKVEVGAISGMVFLPFLLPPIITGMSLLVAMKEFGIDRGENAVILGHLIFILAIGFKTIYARLKSIDPSLMWAARDLGASPLLAFRKVIFPQLKLPLASSAIMSFAISFDETMITLFLVGDGMTLPIRIYGMMRYGFSPEISALVALVLLFTALLALLLAVFSRGRASAITG